MAAAKDQGRLTIGDEVTVSSPFSAFKGKTGVVRDHRSGTLGYGVEFEHLAGFDGLDDLSETVVYFDREELEKT
jgi:hypothetical protein